MNTKHTKGEWHNGKNKATKEWMQVFCNGKVIAEAKKLNKTGQRQSNDFAEEEANARIIAAAPQLLESCIELLSFIQRQFPNENGEAIYDAIQAIKAATE